MKGSKAKRGSEGRVEEQELRTTRASALDAAQVLIRPLLTEKGTTMGERDNAVLFEVSMLANKLQVREAVERLYPVKVLDVRTQIVRGKDRRVRKSSGRRANRKKAIIKLAEGSSIDFFSVK